MGAGSVTRSTAGGAETRSSIFTGCRPPDWRRRSWTRWRAGAASTWCPWTDPASGCPTPHRYAASGPLRTMSPHSRIELGIGRFGVLGVSAGGPYALACAFQIPARLCAVGVVGGLGPVYEDWAAAGMRWHARLAFRLARQAPWLLWPVHGALVGNFMRFCPGLTHRIVVAAAPTADSRVLRRPEVRAPLIASLRESMRQGPGGALQDLRLLARPWGFRLQDIAIPIDLWHGEDDLVVPPEHSRHQAAALPRSRDAVPARRGTLLAPHRAHGRDPGHVDRRRMTTGRCGDPCGPITPRAPRFLSLAGFLTTAPSRGRRGAGL